MMRPATRSVWRVFACLLPLLLTACGIAALGTQPPTQTYVLSTLEDQGATASQPERDVTVGVSTSSFPPYLERKEIVTRSSDNQLVVHQFDKWGSQLQEDFTRSVAANLRVLIPTRHVITPPFVSAFPLDDEIRFSVDRFERLADGTVVLDARWVVVRQPDGRPLSSSQAQIRIPNVGESVADTVAAMSQAVIQLSRQAVIDIPLTPPARSSS